MASTYTTTNKIEKPGNGEQVDNWGTTIDGNFQRIDECLDGILSVSVSGDVTLVSATDATDQIHYAIINIVGGSGGNIIFPNKTGTWLVLNNASGTVTFKNSSGTTVAVLAGEVAQIINDGTNCKALGVGSSSLKSYIDNILVQAKAYTDSTAFGASPGAVPSPTGNAGKYLYTDGATSSWRAIQQSDVSGLPASLTAIQALAISLAVVF